MMVVAATVAACTVVEMMAVAAVAVAAAARKAVGRRVAEERAVAGAGEGRPVGAARAMEVAAAAVMVATAVAASEVVHTVELVVVVPGVAEKARAVEARGWVAAAMVRLAAARAVTVVARAVMAEARAEGEPYSRTKCLCSYGTEAHLRWIHRLPCKSTRCRCPPYAQSCCSRRSDPTTSS